MSRPEEASYPLSPAQREIWLAQSQRPTNPIFVIGECILFPGCLDPVRLQTAIDRLVTEVDALRLRIDPAQPRAALHSRLTVPLDVCDLRQQSDGQRAAEERMTAQMLEPIPFDGRPLARFSLFLVSDESCILHCAYHHIAIDGLSVIMVIHRLAEIYTALTESRPPSLVATASWAEQCEATTDYLQSDAIGKDRAYWLDLLTPPPPLTSLALRPDAPTGFKPGIRSSLELARPVAQTLLEDGVSLTQVLLAATALYVHRMTGLEDIVVALAVGGRIGRPMREVPGNFANVVPVRLAVRPDDTFAGICDGMGQQLRGALRHQRYRMEDIERDLRSAQGAFFRRISVNAIPGERVIRFAELEARNFDLSNDPTEELVISAFDFHHATPLPVDFIGHPDHFDAAELRAHHHRFLLLLEQLAAPGARQRPIRELALPEPATVTSPRDDQLALAVKYRKNADLWDHRPLTAAQRTAWSTAPVALTCPLHCEGPLDLTRLARTLDRLVERHDALRLVLREIDGLTRQRIAPRGRALLQIETGEPNEDLRTPHPVTEGGGPWITLRLWLAETGGSHLRLELHPAVADPAAALQLLSELASLYNGKDLPPAASFAHHLIERAITSSGRRIRLTQEFWRRKLAAADPFELPWPASVDSPPEVAPVRRTLSPELSVAVQATAQAHQVTARDVLLAGWLSLWAHYNDRAAGSLGLILRPEGVSPTGAGLAIGRHEQCLPGVFDLAAAPTFAALLSEVSRVVERAAAHNEVPADFLRAFPGARCAVAFQHLTIPDIEWTWGETAVRLMAPPPTVGHLGIDPANRGARPRSPRPGVSLRRSPGNDRRHRTTRPPLRKPPRRADCRSKPTVAERSSGRCRRRSA